MLGDAIAISFWPFAGLAVLVYFKIESSQTRIIFLVLLGLWIYLPLLFLFAISGFASMPVVFDWHFALFALGIFFFYSGRNAVANDPKAKSKVGSYILGLVARELVFGWRLSAPSHIGRRPDPRLACPTERLQQI
jgi:hypothetical protein